MNILDGVLGKLGGGSGEQSLAASALDMLNNRVGGISGLMEAFQQKGLGHIVASWVGTGENQPVSAEQLQNALGSEQIQDFAGKAGVAPEAAGSQLANLLPVLVDKLTPNGEVPQGDLMSSGMKLLQGLFSKGKSAS